MPGRGPSTSSSSPSPARTSGQAAHSHAHTHAHAHAPSSSSAIPAASRAGLQRMSMSVSHRSSNSWLRGSALASAGAGEQGSREREMESGAGVASGTGTAGERTGRTGPGGVIGGAGAGSASQASSGHLGVSFGTYLMHPDISHSPRPSFSDTSDNIRTRTAQLSNLFSPDTKASAMRRSFSTTSALSAAQDQDQDHDQEPETEGASPQSVSLGISGPSYQSRQSISPSVREPDSGSIDNILSMARASSRRSSLASASAASQAGQATPKPHTRSPEEDEGALGTPDPAPPPGIPTQTQRTTSSSPGRPQSALSVLFARGNRAEGAAAQQKQQKQRGPEVVIEVDEEAVDMDMDGAREPAGNVQGSIQNGHGPALGSGSGSSARNGSAGAGVGYGLHPSESTPLLSSLAGTVHQSLTLAASKLPSPALSRSPHSALRHPLAALSRAAQRGRKQLTADALRKDALEAVRCTPAVLLGMLLNVLDGVSYGMIIFPSHRIFEGFGGLGVSMFFVTTVVAQLTYSLGGSMFAGGNGSMMIEVVPFFNILTYQIIEHVGEDDAAGVIATTLVAFALSSVLTGLVFLFLGAFRLGALIGFFPRHILVGCIGGIGWFLIETGFEVSARLEHFTYTWATFSKLFLDEHTFLLWFPALALAVTIRVITHKWDHQLILPIFFLMVPAVFYIVVAIVHVDMGSLRGQGWVFDIGSSSMPWYTFYTYYDFRRVSWSAIWVTMPTQLALLFFNILHPPLNVPALGVSLGEDDLDTDKELVAHGFSNIFAGLAGTVPNYLVYVNTLMFYRVGGGSRISGLMLAAGTAALLLIGTGPIGFIPIMVVGALIFVLGIDLVKEAVWDTRNRVSMAEYFQIVAIIAAMTIYDFVVGVLFGIVLSCFFFVLTNSRRRCVRAVYSGSAAPSTVRRPPSHRSFLRKVGVQTCIMKLQGFLFFGTISYVEDNIRQLLDVAAWQQNPIRFLILDFSLVPGLDFSSGEALIRIQRLLAAKHVMLVICGTTAESAVGKALQSVGLWTDDMEEVEIFSTLNEALEWTENTYLRAWLGGPTRKVERPEYDQPIDLPGRRREFSFGPTMENSPRHHGIMSAGETIFTTERSLSRDTRQMERREPLYTLLKVFGAYAEDLSDDFFIRLVNYFKPVMLEAGSVLWKQEDESDGIYVVESGVLKATYTFQDQADALEESMVGGTIMGELSGLSGTPRNATVVAERKCDLWRLSLEDLGRMEREQPETARQFVRLVLKVTKNEYDALIAACAKQ